MPLTAWVVLALIALCSVLLVLGAMKLERRLTEWEWLHPPNDDGVTLLEDIEDANSRKSP